jgi:putative membrane protein
MKMLRWIGSVAVVVCGTGGSLALAYPGADAGPPDAVPMRGPADNDPPVGGTLHATLSAGDKPTLQKLHDANQMEMQMGQLAIDRGSSKAVKDFGRQLVNDHTAADKQLGDYLRKRGLDIAVLATTTSADANHELLATKTGVAFDRAFALQMIADHQKVIDLVNSARISTPDDQLRMLYDTLLPTLEAHQKTARTLANARAGA